MTSATGEVLPGLWRFEAAHPEWTEEEGGDEGWERIVAWYAVRTGGGLVLIDPLVENWDPLDALVSDHGGCAAIVRTIHFHQRSIAEAATRYEAEVWAGAAPDGEPLQPSDHLFGQTEQSWGETEAFPMERFDEVALWLPVQRALLFGDAMLRRDTGRLRMCPESWTQPPAGRERLRELLGGLTVHSAEHVLVSHGPLVLGDAPGSLSAAIS